jgi:hypothetical protein
MTKFVSNKDNVYGFKVKCGNEGPKHDPYGYSEYSFEYRGRKYVIHLGLAQWIEVDGKHISANDDVDGINFYDEEEKFVNYVIGDGFWIILEAMINMHYKEKMDAPEWYGY